MSNADPATPDPSTINPATTPPADTSAASSGGVVVSNVSRVLLGVGSRTGLRTASYKFSGAYVGNNAQDNLTKLFNVSLNASTTEVSCGTTTAVQESWDANADGTNSDCILIADNNNYSWKAKVRTDGDAESSASILYFKSDAVPAELSTPTVASITGSGATVTCLFYPNTLHSACWARIQYQSGGPSPGPWTTAGDPAQCSGYSQLTMSRDLALSELTPYKVRLFLSREIAGGPVEVYSPVLSFSTTARGKTPITVTTVAASTVGATSAILNGTIANPDALSTVISYVYGTDATLVSSPMNHTHVTVETTSSTGKSIPYRVSGLSLDTVYYFRMVSDPVEGPYADDSAYDTVLGSILSFTTDKDTEAQAKEDDMLSIQTFDRKYGAATSIYFVAPTISPDSNTFYTGAACWSGAGECKISLDGALWNDTTSDPAVIANAAGLFKLDLTAGELACDEAFIMLHDAAGSPAVRDILIRVRTHVELGSVDIDAATGARANRSALKLTGYQAGAGLEAIGGATGVDIDAIQASNFLHVGTAGTQHTVSGTKILLATTSNTTDDIYNGCLIGIIGGTGAGQSRLILDYVGGTYPSGATNDGNREAQVDTAWKTNPDNTSVYAITPGPRTWEQGPTVELSTVPTTTSGYGKFLQLLFQRFAFAVSQDPTVQTWYKADGTTPIFDRAVSDTGGVQTVGTLTDY